MIADAMFSTFADAAAQSIPNAGAIIGTLLAGMATGIGGVWTWFRGELQDCKADRKTLFAELKELNERVAELSLRVGHVEKTA